MGNKKQQALFGKNVNPIVRTWHHAAPKGVALDIGSARGATTKFLADSGFSVIAIDNEQYDEFPTGSNIKYRVCNVLGFPFNDRQFSLVVACNVLQFLKRSDKYRIMNEIYDNLVPNGIFIMTSFNTDDEGYIRAKERKLNEMEENSFFSPRLESYMSFFHRGEAKTWATDKSGSILYASDNVVDDNHPPNGPHTHGIVSLVFKKNG